MSDEELALSTVAGWTIASALAHIAFWDFRIIYLVIVLSAVALPKIGLAQNA